VVGLQSLEGDLLLGVFNHSCWVSNYPYTDVVSGYDTLSKMPALMECHELDPF
jgi:hypothetical protein